MIGWTSVTALLLGMSTSVSWYSQIVFYYLPIATFIKSTNGRRNQRCATLQSGIPRLAQRAQAVSCLQSVYPARTWIMKVVSIPPRLTIHTLHHPPKFHDIVRSKWAPLWLWSPSKPFYPRVYRILTNESPRALQTRYHPWLFTGRSQTYSRHSGRVWTCFWKICYLPTRP